MKTAKNYQRAALYHLQSSETQKIFAAFTAKSIPVIAFKGVTLRERLFDNPESREMCDIDLLIREQDLEDVEALMQELGYTFFSDDIGGNQAFLKAYDGELSYNKSAMLVDIHWKLIATYWIDAVTRINMPDVWSRALPVKVAGEDALRLCPEDEVLHLCFHVVTKHHLGQSHGFFDIKGVLQEAGDTFDWETFIERAKEWHVRVASWAVLDIIATNEPSMVPASVLPALRVPQWQQKLLRTLIHRDHKRPDARNGDNITVLGALTADSFWDIVRIIRVRLFPGQHFVQLRYQLTPFQAFFRQFVYPLDYLRERRHRHSNQ